MKSLSLSGSDWQLTGYWRNQWTIRKEREKASHLQPAIPRMPAVVPGAIHADLRKAGLVPDWNVGLNSLASEWVNLRDWAFDKRVQVPADFDGRLTLEFDGLDYSGHVGINGEIIGSFEGTHLRHEFDVTGRLRPGSEAALEVIFYPSPEIDPQSGMTSRTRIFKPRFGYSWDWCARLVNIGIWQDVRLVCRGEARLRDPLVRAVLNDDSAGGRVEVRSAVEGSAGSLRYSLAEPRGKVLAAGEVAAAGNSVTLDVDVAKVRPWWPATHGDQPLYALTLELLDASGKVSDRVERTLGFKRVRWLQNPVVPEGARPYLCEVNGRPLYLRGANWVPASPFYGTVHERRYEALLRLYANMHANLLRVWGGGILERPEFYDGCDRLGIFVWQEFPLSSSGPENWPPEDPEVVATLKRIAEEYVCRRSHHASHLVWCGGNELQGSLDGAKTGGGKPVDESHPCIGMFAEVCARLDPGKRFFPTSPTGPRFFANKEDFGKGLHHHSHGPWANMPLTERYEYFNNDDSMFRTELGAPGCESLEAILRFKGDQKAWPPRADNIYWLHPGAWWIPWTDVTREFGPVADDERELPFVVKASRYLQASSYRYAAEAVRRRAPGCGAFVIWMGHDDDHCTSNNSAIEVTGWPKPAYAWLQKAYASLNVSLRHDRCAYRPGEELTGQVFVTRNAGEPPAAGIVRARLMSVTGETLASIELPVNLAGEENVCAGPLRWTLPDAPHHLFIVDLSLELPGAAVSNRYLLSQVAEHPMSPLRSLPDAAVVVVGTDRIDRNRRRLTVRNDGPVAAVGVELAARSTASAVLADRNYLTVLPGETAAVEFELLHTYFAGARQSRDARLQVEWFNGRSPVPVA